MFIVPWGSTYGLTCGVTVSKYCENNGRENKYSELENKAGSLGLRKGQKLRFIVNAIFNDYPDYTPKFLEETKSILEEVFNHDEAGWFYWYYRWYG